MFSAAKGSVKDIFCNLTVAEVVTVLQRKGYRETEWGKWQQNKS